MAKSGAWVFETADRIIKTQGMTIVISLLNWAR